MDPQERLNHMLLSCIAEVRRLSECKSQNVREILLTLLKRRLQEFLNCQMGFGNLDTWVQEHPHNAFERVATKMVRDIWTEDRCAQMQTVPDRIWCAVAQRIGTWVAVTTGIVRDYEEYHRTITGGLLRAVAEKK